MIRRSAALPATAFTARRRRTRHGASLRACRSARAACHEGRIEAQLDVRLRRRAICAVRKARCRPRRRSVAFVPRMPWLEQEVAHQIHGLRSSALLVNATASAGVVEHLRRRELRVEAGEIGAGGLRHLVLGAPCPCRRVRIIRPIVSYQMPTSALPKSGLSFSVSVLTTMRSMISPGSARNRTPSWRPASARIVGDQRVPGHHRGRRRCVLKAATMSASEVLTTLMSFSFSFDRIERPRQQVVRHRELDEVDLLALDVGERWPCPSG